MSRKTDIEEQIDLDQSVEYILENKAGWTDFTRWYTQQQGVGHVKANRMWKKAMAKVSEMIDDDIKQTVDKTMIELENLKARARQENDRRTELDAIKYQAKIAGAEVERQQVDVNLKNVDLKWGQTNEN